MGLAAPRGGLPQPFSRPGIVISDGGKKDWKEVSVFSVAVGDMVRGMGLVTDLWEAPGGIILVFKSGTQQFFTEGDKVTAFVKA
jgi:hypothetical protein